MAGRILNAVCLCVFVNVFDPQSFEVDTMIIIIPIHRCTERLSDLPDDQQHLVAYAPAQHCTPSVCFALLPPQKGKIVNKSSFLLWWI